MRICFSVHGYKSPHPSTETQLCLASFHDPPFARVPKTLPRFTLFRRRLLPHLWKLAFSIVARSGPSLGINKDHAQSAPPATYGLVGFGGVYSDVALATDFCAYGRKFSCVGIITTCFDGTDLAHTVNIYRTLKYGRDDLNCHEANTDLKPQ